MNLHALALARLDRGEGPIRVGLIGAGKFGTMFLAQARHTEGLQLVAVADLQPARAEAALAAAGWPAEQAGAADAGEALRRGATWITDDPVAAIAAEAVEVVVEATGNPAAGLRHARSCLEHGRHAVMVNVEADALAGPLLAEEFRKAGLVYSLAYGDQPALVCELVDWARACGFPVVAAGKGTKYLPDYHAITPEDVWEHYGITAERAEAGGMNPQMFTSFMDGTKSAIEMAAVANATGLAPAPDGLAFPPCGVDDLPAVLRPRELGGRLHHAGQVEVVSSLERDRRPVERDLRWGVYVVFEAPSDYTARCFREYGVVTDATGRYAALFRPYHLIGLELGISVANAALRGEPTGAPTGFRGDVAAVAKRDLEAGERLDGEGGHRVWGRLVPAADSLGTGALPIGLAHGVRLSRAVRRGETLTTADVALDEADEAVRTRRAMEAAFAPETKRAAQ